MKIDELIKKWENNFKKIDGKGLPLEEWSAYWAINEFIKDLKSLQEPTEREVEISDNLEAWYKTSCPYCEYEEIHTTSNYCGGCGAKIKWVDKMF